jgi:hypothetical protein
MGSVNIASDFQGVNRRRTNDEIVYHTIFSVYSDSGFKYPACRISEEIVGFNEYTDILQRSNGGCECASCSLCGNYYSKSIYAFFSERRREHYDELNNNVFIWLDNLHLEFFEDENPHYILEKIQIEMATDSMFYDDARKHMSKKMKQNIENFEKNLSACNVCIHTSNVTIDNRIKEIIARPVYAKLTNEQVSSIYRIVQIGFSQTIKGDDEVSTIIRKWDFSSKLQTYGFTEQDVDNASNILGAVQQDQIIVECPIQVRKNIARLKSQQDVIKKQSKEISSRIASHHYRARHRCCPSLIKELWHGF